MKITRSVRFSDEIWKGVNWFLQHEGGDASEAIRRLVTRGLECEMAQMYARGKISLRELADVLSRSPREALELLFNMGVTGNISTSQAVSAFETAWDLGES